MATPELKISAAALTISVDDFSGVLQRRCRQLERYLDQPTIVPEHVIQHLQAMYSVALELKARVDEIAASKAAESAEKPN